MMQQDIGSPRRIHTQGCTNNSTSSQMSFDNISLEILVQVISYTHGPKAQRIR